MGRCSEGKEPFCAGSVQVGRLDPGQNLGEHCLFVATEGHHAPGRDHAGEAAAARDLPLHPHVPRGEPARGRAAQLRLGGALLAQLQQLQRRLQPHLHQVLTAAAPLGRDSICTAACSLCHQLWALDRSQCFKCSSVE